MQVNITLSNKEKRHYFLYLLGMMLITILIVSVITLRKFHSPFSDADLHTVLILQEKQDMQNTKENVALFKQQYDNCLINVKEKAQQMNQRDNALLMHNGR